MHQIRVILILLLLRALFCFFGFIGLLLVQYSLYLNYDDTHPEKALMHRFLPANQHQHHKRNKEYNIGNQYNFPKQFLFASRIRLVPVVLYLLLQHPRIRPQRKTHHQPEHLLIVVFPLHGQKQQHNRRGKNRNHQPKFDFPCACRHTPPTTLLDYFPDDFILFVDESHVTLPQVRAMYNGDHARKKSLVDYGFRLPSAYDNRPLTFDEFTDRIHQAIYVSATPAEYERSRAGQIAEQVIRPTGLLDPEVFVRPIEGQIDDLIGEINATTDKGERTLVTTLTKKMAEDLTKYLTENGIRVRYMHSDIGAMERMEIIRDLRMAKFDVLVGINLLREGLDLPEVSLIAILDADKEGFLRSETSLIQTIGRAARNAQGRVLLYADKITPAMRAAMDETARRRQIQDAYNKAHGIVPKTIVKSIRDLIEISASPTPEHKGKGGVKMTRQELAREIEKLEAQMRKAAHMMEYEYAAVLRDEIIRLRTEADKK